MTANRVVLRVRRRPHEAYGPPTTWPLQYEQWRAEEERRGVDLGAGLRVGDVVTVTFTGVQQTGVLTALDADWLTVEVPQP